MKKDYFFALCKAVRKKQVATEKNSKYLQVKAEDILFSLKSSYNDYNQEIKKVYAYMYQLEKMGLIKINKYGSKYKHTYFGLDHKGVKYIESLKKGVA